jgi:hypothetical protein
MTRRKKMLGVGLGVAAIALALAIAFSGGRTIGPSSAGAAVSNFGTPMKLGSASGPQDMVASWLMAKRGGKDFYRLALRDGRTCYGIGKAATFSAGLDLFACSDDFPAAAPLLDVSIVGADRPETTLHVITLQGFATDRISEVLVRDPAGGIAGRASVVDNVYWVQLPAGTDGRTIEALDRSGKTVYRLPA